MLASLQSTLTEGFASMTRRFDNVLAIQATFGTQLQALSDNYRQTQDYLDSLRDQLGNIEEQVNGRQSPPSSHSPTF